MPQPYKTPGPQQPSIWGLLKPYRGFIILLTLFAVIANGVSLLIPKITARGIDTFSQGTYTFGVLGTEFVLAAVGVLIFTALQNVMQTYASERVARDLREKVAAKISRQSYTYIQTASPAKLLTNLTSDVDAVKLFVSQAIVSIISSLFLIVGASTLLLVTDWKLALVVLLIIPIIGGTFFVVFGRIRNLFKQRQEIIDWLNKVINESILGAAIIRVLHSEKEESTKFSEANTKALSTGYQILRLFASMIPIITFVVNLATLAILALGGHFVITNSLSLGNFAAFNSYLAILIFPIIILGFMSNVIAQATASYMRINEVLSAPENERTGTVTTPLSGSITTENLCLQFGEKAALKDISLTIRPHTKTAIIGPTAAGKTQLLYLLIGILKPTTGTISYDATLLSEYEPTHFHNQVGFVFQDSIMFNLTLRENIAFSTAVSDSDLQKAIDTAELSDFIASLPNGLDTVVSERGASLSGGQKQRIMLARALALNPKMLFLDDFTARVDTSTEQRILANLEKNYPDLTLVSVTQKIASVEQYDQIILLMEGEILGIGTHDSLMTSCPEYVQLYTSQRSTNTYELHA
jgi:ATP-binding cassette subfamily B protein